MIRRLSYCLLAVLVLVSSCAKDPVLSEGSGIEISVHCGDVIPTKSDSGDSRDGEDKYNENLISSVDFFFYPGKNPDRNADAVFHVRRESGQRGSDVFLLDLTEEDVNTYIFPKTPSEVYHATVFAIANYPGTLVLNELDLSGTSLNELEALEVETDFVLTPPTNYPNLLNSNYKQENFLMSGSVVLDLLSRTSNIVAKGAIELVRYASKLTVSIKVAESVTLGDSVWEPMLEDMAIYLVNGVNTVTLGGEDPSPQYFSYVGNKKMFAYKDTQDGDKIKPLVSKTGDYFDAHPMYMYPQHWNNAETDTSNGTAEPYLKLELPWHRTTEGGYNATQKQCYYKIFIPMDNRGPEYLRHFVRNNWYHLDIDVGLLGADTDDAAVELQGSFFLVPWQNVKREIDRMAEIGSARYLSVDRNHYELNNLNTTNIRYTSSHPVVLEDIRVTCPYYGEATSGTARGGVITKVTRDDDIYPKNTYYLNYDKAHRKALNGGEDWLTDIGTAIRFSHSINNDYKDTMFDYSPFTVSFTIAQEGTTDERYRKSITLIQSPAIYISSLPNSDDTFVQTTHKLNNQPQYVFHSDHWGYVYVDGRQIVRSNATYDEVNKKWVEVPSYHADTAPNINQEYLDFFKSQYPNMESYGPEDFHWRVVWYTGGGRDIFRINVTVLPDDSDLVIGDPRTDEVNNLNQTFQEADALEGGQRTLTYYYPAEKSSRTANMLAPSFRISTKCGGTEFGDLTEDQAKWRCASYQEDGFPAGRWRLPTKGEIKFMAQLSANGAFARLFSASGKYWSANGGIQVSGSSVTDVTTDKAMTRCVYDTWYWGDEQTNHPVDGRAHFYWGDQER